MLKSFKFRIYPTQEQRGKINKTIDCPRFIYNKMLENKIKYYEQTGKFLKDSFSWYKRKYKWLNEVDSTALNNGREHLNTAYNNFMRVKGKGHPKFKTKRRSKKTYTTAYVNNNIRLEKNTIRLPKIGYVKIKLHRQLPRLYRIKNCTIEHTNSGKYYISILAESEYSTPKIELDRNKSVGLDYSSPSFYVGSQSVKANHPKFYRKCESKIKKEQRALSRKVQGSRNYEKQRIKLVKVYDKIVNRRKDWLNNLSIRLVKRYDYICIEDLGVVEIGKILRLGKNTCDNSWGIFVKMLQYKADSFGKKLIKIDRWFPSSKTCRFCGYINKNLKLKGREWECRCGARILRDGNAAINILNEGLKLV